nr:hypothetical protein [Escherichia coli]
MIRSGDFFDFHFDRDNNSMRKGKIIVASMMVLCVLIFVAAAAWFMLFQGEMTGADRGGKTGGNFTRCGPDEIRDPG